MNVGEKYYTKKNGKILILRIKKLGEQVTVLVGDDKFKIPKDKLIKEYTLLKPHGSIFFNIVNLHNTSNDIIVTLFREEDKKTDQIPYAVCRQNITDFFTKNVINIQRAQGKIVEDVDYIGLSLSKDTCMDDIPYEVMVACDGIQYSEEIAIYLDDTIEDILSLINKSSRYNKVLQQLYDDSEKLELKGCCHNINDLLKDNHFIEDFERGFKIHSVDFELIANFDYSLINEQRIYFEKLINVEMINTYLYEYNYDIDVDKIEREHILIRDNTGWLFILAYDKGEYIEKDKRKVIQLSRDIKNNMNNNK